MNRDDLNAISEIMAKYGYVEWSLVGFTPLREYSIFSYFTDPSILTVFKLVLLEMLKTLNEYTEERAHEAYAGNSGTC
ncbi:MAG: hypothetical protein AB1442_18165 [Nitrospirota bacterium]